MKAYEVRKDLWYLPFNKVLIKVNKHCNNELKFYDYIGIDFLDGLQDYSDQLIKLPDENFNFSNSYPYDIGVIPANQCNLRCIYCYSEAGSKSKLSLTKDKVNVIVNELIKNALIHKRVKAKESVVKISLCGGGEPTYDWDLFKYIVDEVKKKTKDNGLKNEITLVTNGILSDKKIDYIITQIDNILLSYDGTEEFQNNQRISSSNKTTYEMVHKFIRKCEQSNKRLVIRSTIMPENFNKIDMICENVFNNYSNVNVLHVEPLFYQGKGKKFDLEMSYVYDEFMNGYLQAEKLVNQKFSDKLFYTSMFLYDMKEYYCSATIGLNPWIHMDGKIMQCTDYVTEKKHYVGYVGDKTIEYYDYDRMLGNLSVCEKCYAYYQCGGGCISNIPKDEYGNCANESAREICKMIKNYWRLAFEKLLKGEKFGKLTSRKIFKNDSRGFEAYIIEEFR